jgi:hypothetical protein
MKKLSEILDFFRANQCDVKIYENSNSIIFSLWCEVRKREIFDGNEYQLRNFYNQLNNI